MRLLLDTSVWGPTAATLRAAGHDVIWIGDRAVDPGDLAILEEARRDPRVLVTLDKDFGELAVRGDRPRSGLVRLERVPPAEQAGVCLRVLERWGSVLLAGAIVTARPDRARVRYPRDAE